MNSTNPMQHNCLIKKECTGIPHETYSKLVHTYQNHIEGHMKMKAMLLTVEESRTPWIGLCATLSFNLSEEHCWLSLVSPVEITVFGHANRKGPEHCPTSMAS